MLIFLNLHVCKILRKLLLHLQSSTTFQCTHSIPVDRGRVCQGGVRFENSHKMLFISQCEQYDSITVLTKLMNYFLLTLDLKLYLWKFRRDWGHHQSKCSVRTVTFKSFFGTRLLMFTLYMYFHLSL